MGAPSRHVGILYYLWSDPRVRLFPHFTHSSGSSQLSTTRAGPVASNLADLVLGSFTWSDYRAML